MRHPRVRLAIAASLVPVAVALVISCSFPEIRFQEGSSGAGSSTSASTSTSSTMSTTTSSGGGAGGAGGTGGTSESASTSASTGSETDGGLPCNNKECDCDGDGVKAVLGSCGGTDCADYDERAHPDAGFVRSPEKIRGPKSTDLDYDFDCNGSAQHEFGGVDCKPAGIGNCSGDGFAQEPECGTLGKFVPCKYDGLFGGCIEKPAAEQYQGCK